MITFCVASRFSLRSFCDDVAPIPRSNLALFCFVASSNCTIASEAVTLSAPADCSRIDGEGVRGRCCARDFSWNRSSNVCAVSNLCRRAQERW